MKYFLLIKLNLTNFQIITLMMAVILDTCFSILAIVAIIPLSDIIQNLPTESYSEVTEFTKKILENFGFNLTITTASIIFLLANFIKPVSNYYLQYKAIRVKYSVLNNMLNNLLKSVFNSEWRGIEKVTNGVIVNVFTKEIYSLGDGLSLIIMRLITSVQFLSYTCVPLYIDFNLSVTVFIGFLFVVAPFMALTIIGKKYGYANLETVNNLVGFVSEMTRNLKVFVATNTGNFAFKKFQLYFNDHLSATLRAQLFDKALGVFFRPLALSVVIIILVYRSLEGSDLTNIITLIWSLISIIPIINMFIQTKLSFSILEPSFLQVEQLLKSLSETAVTSNNVQPVRGNYDITFDNVTYSAGGINLVERIKFKFPKSKITCIVGPSGSGKSTIVELIIGLKSVNSGRILYNGVDAQKIDYFHLRDNLGYVGQDPVKLNGSIRENIFWRKETLNEPDFRKMIVSSNCEFIWDFPMQLDELLGENRVQLSGGQWQRLSILRAIVSRPKLLILDEATSALDTASEQRVIEGLKSLSWSPTIVMVSHRLGPIDCADEILNLELNGE